MLPALIHESFTTSFNFYRDGKIHQGIVCQNRMHALIKAFRREDRGRAMAMALKLSHHQVQTLITVSPCSNFYRVWVELQSHDSELLQALLSGKYENLLRDDARELVTK